MRIELDKVIPSDVSINLHGSETKILKLIWEAKLNGEPVPTHREIVKSVGISSTSEVGRWLKSLKSKGLISKDFKKSRAIELDQDKVILFVSEVSNLI